MVYIFSIVDDILIVGFDEEGKDHDETLDKVLWVYRQVNVSLTKISVFSDVSVFLSLVK